jgi:PAS domain S-box-containing protein
MSAKKESEELYRVLAENAKDVIATFDMELNIIYVSPSVKSLFGYLPEELHSKSIVELLTPDSLAIVNQAFTEALELERKVGKDGYEAPPLEVQILHKNGQRIWAEVSRVFLRDEKEQPTGILIIIRDLVKRKEMENELAASNRDLKLYTSLLRHDLRNDLQIILAQAEAVSMLLPKDSDIIKVCEVTQNAAIRMKQLINAFEIPEEQLTDNVITLLEARMQHAEKTHYGLKGIVKTGDDLTTLRVVRGRLLPALFDNLLRNSYQHAGPKVEVEISVSTHNGSVLIDVADSGSGVPEIIKPTLFEKGMSTVGRGQGLYLCRRIAEAYGGSIRLLEQSKTTGATFRVVLPQS